MHAPPWKSGPLGSRKFHKFTGASAPVVALQQLRLLMALRLLHLSLAWLGILLLTALISCSHPEPAASAAPVDSATRLQAVPAANHDAYSGKSAKKDWKNPYLIVREDGIGLLDLANHEIHILKPDEVPAALAALPISAWPYGRVVAVREGEMSSIPESTKVRVRKNRALLAGTLEELKIAIHWIPSA